MKKISVGNKAMSTRVTADKYLAATICISVRGFVRSNSIVPDFCSSANILIVTAVIKKRKSQGAIINSESRVA
jgi:hypothetical protein